MGTQSLSLKWNNHQRNLVDVFEQLLWNEDFVDVTLACEGVTLKAHKTLLSACSSFFHALFLEHPCKHPVIIMKDVKYADLKSIIEFMYKGEIIVPQDRLTEFLKTAETLKVKGLTESPSHQSEEFVLQENVSSQSHTSSQTHSTIDETHLEINYSPQKKRKRTRGGCRGSLNDLGDDEHQSSSKDAHHHTIADSSKTAIDSNSNEVSSQRISFSQNLHEDIISILPKDLCTAFNESLIDVGSNIEITNIPENQVRKENVQIFPSSELCALEIEATNSESLSSPTTAVCSLDTKVSNSRLISQEQQKDIKPSSLSTFQDPPVSYEIGPSHTEDSDLAIGSIKIETSPECEQPPEDDQSQVLFPSTSRCVNATDSTLMENSSKVKQTSGLKTNSQNTNKHSKKFISNQNIANTINRSLGICLFQHEDKELAQKSAKHICTICQKTFLYNSKLVSHLRTHSGERPYACHYCEKTFKHRGHLSTHQRIHHDLM